VVAVVAVTVVIVVAIADLIHLAVWSTQNAATGRLRQALLDTTLLGRLWTRQATLSRPTATCGPAPLRTRRG
jgi:hypothetical protein